MKPTVKQTRSKAGFADLYLERYGSGSVEGLPGPDPDLFLIVTIPAYKEPHLAESLQSLLDCEPPGVRWEILVNINFPENAPEEVREISRASLAVVNGISQNHGRSDVSVHALWNPDMPVRHAGVGLARKIAMDTAVDRFNRIGRKDGVMVAFDADSSCEPGFLARIARFYLSRQGARCANHYFEHPLEGPLESRIYEAIGQYELYLRYMRLAIGTTGHPHAIHTVGSSFSVRARTYIKVNGMGRDKAGEDFYFLHKCILQGNFWEINDTAVYPSPRESDRVSFGTGATIQRQSNASEQLSVYCLDSFNPLREIFSRVRIFWEGLESGEFSKDWLMVSTAIGEFLAMQDAENNMRRMHRDSAGFETFRDKFFAWFNGFMILRYLNEVHKTHLSRSPVMEESLKLAEKLGIESSPTVKGLLENYREYEKGKGNRKII